MRRLIRSRRGRRWLHAVVLVASAAAFLVLCRRYDVVQDDAYISLVYAKNLAAGEGLVFNPGERVEGYTNFLWTLILTVPHTVGVDAVAVARGLGLAAALALIALSWRTAATLGPQPAAAWSLGPPVLLATNGSLAFWALSGLETTAFALLVTAGATRYLHRARLDVSAGCLFGLAALMRPEGFLFFGLTGLHQLARQGWGWSVWWRELRRLVAPIGVFLILVTPHILFRVLYYGQLLPNTFHAKTGISLNYFGHGLRYTLEFLGDYGFWGLGPLALALLTLRRRTRAGATYLALLVFIYGTYVTLVGGDTLAENRLFLPVLALLCVGSVEAVRLVLLRVLGRRWAPVAGGALLLAAAAHTSTSADAEIRHARDAARDHNHKLHDLADHVLDVGGVDLVASTAIGIPRYRSPAAVLDLVGLTDSTIARHPQRLPGIRDDHILRNYQVNYALDRAPDLIYFITGLRPATPAERALFLSRRFRRDYYLTFLRGQRPVFARRQDRGDGVEALHADGAFVELYSEALVMRGADPAGAQLLFERCIELGPTDFAAPHYWLGRLHYDEGRFDAAAAHFERALDIDDHEVMAWAHLAFIDHAAGRRQGAVARATRAVDLAPHSQFCNYVLGRALLGAGRPEAAAPVLARAMDMNGAQSLDALYWFGVAAQREGREQVARSAWTNVVRLDTGHAAARRALQRLDRR